MLFLLGSGINLAMVQFEVNLIKAFGFRVDLTNELKEITTISSTSCVSIHLTLTHHMGFVRLIQEQVCIPVTFVESVVIHVPNVWECTLKVLEDFASVMYCTKQSLHALTTCTTIEAQHHRYPLRQHRFQHGGCALLIKQRSTSWTASLFERSQNMRPLVGCCRAGAWATWSTLRSRDGPADDASNFLSRFWGSGWRISDIRSLHALEDQGASVDRDTRIAPL